MLRIELVRIGDQLVGRTLSDRWNLIQLGIGPIAHDRNQSSIKRFRRALDREGFKIIVVRNGTPQWSATPAELAAFNGAVPDFLSQAA